jgi:hypothetical protein
MSPQLHEFLAHLERVTGRGAQPSGNGWRGHCPAHDDRRPSLSVCDGADGRVLVHCHAGCGAAAVTAALGLDLKVLGSSERSNTPARHSMPSGHGLRDGSAPGRSDPIACPLGTQWEPLGVERFKTHAHAWAALTRRWGEPHQHWQYLDRHGQLVGLVLRWHLPGGKEIRPLARVDGGWIIGAMKAPRPLYRLPELLPPILAERETDFPPLERVWIVEGEKAAEAGRAVGLLTTTSSGGAAAAHLSDWSPLAGREVVLVPDRDEAGLRYVEAVKHQLACLQPPPALRELALGELSVGGDLADFVAGRSPMSPDALREELETRANQSEPLPANHFQELSMNTTTSPAHPTHPHFVARSETTPVTVRLDECVAAPLRWLWPGRIPLGKLTLLIGDPGLGKSFVTLDLAARISRGDALPQLDGEQQATPCQAGSAILLSAEDDACDTIRPRLLSANADLTKLTLLEAVRLCDSQDGTTLDTDFSLATDVNVLDRLIQSIPDCRLVIIDPITAYLGRSDSHKNAEMRALLAPLSELSARSGVAVLAINHLNKMGQGPAIYRSMGSLAFAATARSVLAVLADPFDPNQRVLVTLKCNLASRSEGIRFEIVAAPDAARDPAVASSPVVCWKKSPVYLTADEILAATQSAAIGPALDEACEWLQTTLADGPEPAIELKRRAKEDGIHERTLLRAKARLGVVASRTGYGLHGTWSWQLPKA